MSTHSSLRLRQSQRPVSSSNKQSPLSTSKKKTYCYCDSRHGLTALKKNVFVNGFAITCGFLARAFSSEFGEGFSGFRLDAQLVISEIKHCVFVVISTATAVAVGVGGISITAGIGFVFRVSSLITHCDH